MLQRKWQSNGAALVKRGDIMLDIICWVTYVVYHRL